jgi:hypothetical protein
MPAGALRLDVAHHIGGGARIHEETPVMPAGALRRIFLNGLPRFNGCGVRGNAGDARRGIKTVKTR